MYTPRSQPHFAPFSAGALMDPVFLRRVVSDVEASGHADETRPPPVNARWRIAKCAVTAFLSHLASR